ncbi:hypothetical protein AcV7_005468 [Taiwanofungus camphoratus]|nr:hypothetical protein AcV7_005468 [Antrodia cinnamomea]
MRAASVCGRDRGCTQQRASSVEHRESWQETNTGDCPPAARAQYSVLLPAGHPRAVVCLPYRASSCTCHGACPLPFSSLPSPPLPFPSLLLFSLRRPRHHPAPRPWPAARATPPLTPPRRTRTALLLLAGQPTCIAALRERTRIAHRTSHIAGRPGPSSSSRWPPRASLPSFCQRDCASWS